MLPRAGPNPEHHCARRGDDPEQLTDARANELLSERRAKEASGETKKKSTKKSSKKTTKKKATKKATKKSTKKAGKKATKKPSPGTKNVVKAGSRKK